LKTTSLRNQAGISRLKLFLALSRTPHGLLDMATPGLSALLWLGTFPSFEVIGLGLLTAFSGYTAVYALNDVIDYRVDREKIRSGDLAESRPDLDSVFVRHPLAQGLLSYREGVLWMAAWGALTLMGAYFLNPVCAFIFLFACLLETIYCRLLKITHLRGILSGAVKTSGPVAAVFAVDPDPALYFLIVLFLWLFFWEIGGQNIPNDMADLEEDRKLKAKTIPVQFGLPGSTGIILISLVTAVAMSLMIPSVRLKGMSLFYFTGAFFSGVYFLFLPAFRLYKTKNSAEAFGLFNRASYYPLAMLVVTILSWVVSF
jgi:4-hydroxybenzoate polyprenyltransferase